MSFFKAMMGNGNVPRPRSRGESGALSPPRTQSRGVASLPAESEIPESRNPEIADPQFRLPSRSRVPHGSAAAQFWRRGEPQVWATAAALAGVLLLASVLLAVVAVNGLGVFWPSPVAEIVLSDGRTLWGIRIRDEVNPDTGRTSVQFKTGNRERDPHRQDFLWVEQDAIRSVAYPPEAVVLERIEHGVFLGRVKSVSGPDVPIEAVRSADLAAALGAVREKSGAEIAPIAAELLALSARLRQTRDAVLRLRYRSERSTETADAPPNGPRPRPKGAKAEAMERRIAELENAAGEIRERSDRLVHEQQRREAELRKNVVVMADASGAETPVALIDIVRYCRPNAMGFLAKCGHYLGKLGEFLWDNPRESNTEGGLFPAIFGTVLLIFLMAAACFPLGVLAGIYLGEYAKDDSLVRMVRIAVNNLAGIPSIVYGIFGLGFFVYGVGGFIDQWFFPERLAVGEPTFGTGGILWASLTLGLLTLPVVIVSTEEALRVIPRAAREGSYALGATKLQTLVRVLLPMASPGIMTGFILAMARAAGEVAPLMITGVVKLAPQMPLDGTFPFLHLDRKFMHLGFHIYDVGFQSPNAEASRPMVYATTLLLLAIVLVMSSTAIWLRNRMRKRLLARTI